jgi:hypothetical protein
LDSDSLTGKLDFLFEEAEGEAQKLAVKSYVLWRQNPSHANLTPLLRFKRHP